MDLNDYKKIDGKIIKEDEISIEELNRIKVDAVENIALLTDAKAKLIKEYDDQILKWQTKIDKINSLLK